MCCVCLIGKLIKKPTLGLRWTKVSWLLMVFPKDVTSLSFKGSWIFLQAPHSTCSSHVFLKLKKCRESLHLCRSSNHLVLLEIPAKVNKEAPFHDPLPIILCSEASRSRKELGDFKFLTRQATHLPCLRSTPIQVKTATEWLQTAHQAQGFQQKGESAHWKTPWGASEQNSMSKKRNFKRSQKLEIKPGIC